MLAICKDAYARDLPSGERQTYAPGAVIEATAREITEEAGRKFPRLVGHTPEDASADAVLDREIADMQAADDRRITERLAALRDQKAQREYVRDVRGPRIGSQRDEADGFQEAFAKATGFAPVEAI
jgi:hypothetical protein